MTGLETISLGVDADTAIHLEPEEYAARLLFVIRALTERDPTYRPRHDGFQQQSRRYLIGYEQPTAGSPGSEHKQKQVDWAFSEAWAWLEVQGLLVPDRGDQKNAGSVSGLRRLSRRAHRFVDVVDVSRYAAARLLPRDSLHPAIAQTVWSAFIRGEYDGAVSQVMKAVEVAVRNASEASGCSAGLMLNAFGVKGDEKKGDQKENGPLTDPEADHNESRGIRNLFVGAMTVHRNPQAHTYVNLDNPVEAVEIVMFANHLLRIVDRRRAAQPAGSTSPKE